VLKNIYQALMLMQEDLGISLTSLSDGHPFKGLVFQDKLGKPVPERSN